MADTTALKNRIRAAIKANDNQEITGPVLQQTLLDIVDELSDRIIDEYGFIGVAIPSTTPPSDLTEYSRVFYLTAQNGVYTNLGGVEVSNEIAVIKYNGSNWSKESCISIDNKPTPESNSLVRSGGVQNELALGAVYDVSAKNPTAGPNNDGKFDSLSALLSDANLNTLIPTAVRKGGMSIKFIQSSDNKYVQYRYMGTDVTTVATFTNTANWQGVDDEPVAGSRNLVESGGVYDKAVVGKILNKLPEADFVVGKTIKAVDGSIVTESYSTNTTITTFNVTGSDMLYGMYFRNGNGNDLAVAFYDSSDTFINSGQIFGYYIGVFWGSISVPINATKVRIVMNSGNHTTLFKISYVDKEFDSKSNLPVANKVITAALTKLYGYAYQGIATASTNPGIPEGKVFYFAQTAGTYTNFNNLIVKQGFAILKYNNGWTLEQLFVTNDYITDSDDLLLSSAVKNSSVVVEGKSTDIVSSKYLQKDGTLVSGASAARKNYSFDIVEGNTYLVYGFTESNINYVVFCCYDSNGVYVPLVQQASRRGNSLKATYLTFVAPIGATKCIVHTNNFAAKLWELNNIFFDDIPTDGSRKLIYSGSLYGVYYGSSKKLSHILYEENKYINTQGQVVSGSGNVSTFNVTSGSRLLVYCVCIANTSAFLNIAFYNEDTFISGENSPFLPSRGGQYFKVTVPENATVVKIWSNNSYPVQCYKTVLITDSVLLNDGRAISSDGVAKAISPFDSRITNLENILDVENVISVKKDGTGDYTTLRAAIDYAKNHTPITIQIYAGTYNISDEYTTEEINAASLSGFCGWDVWDGINLKGMSNNRADVVLHAEVSLDDTPSLARQAISTLNLRGNNRIENLTITSRNVRYPIHDDFSSNNGKVHEIINCYIESYFPYYWGGAWNGIGYGAQKFKKLYIDGCEVYPSIMCHNGNQAGGSDIIIKDTKTRAISLIAYADMDMDRYQFYNVSYDRLSLTGANVSGFNVVSTHNSKGIIVCRTQDNYVTEEVQKISRVTITASIGQAAYVDEDLHLASSGTFYGIHISDISNNNALVQTCGIISENKLGGVDTTAWAVGDELSVGSNGKLEKSSTAPVAKVKYIIDGVKYIKLL